MTSPSLRAPRRVGSRRVPARWPAGLVGLLLLPACVGGRGCGGVPGVGSDQAAVARGPFVPPADEAHRCTEEPPDQQLPEGLAWAVEARVNFDFSPSPPTSWTWPLALDGPTPSHSDLRWYVQPAAGPIWVLESEMRPSAGMAGLTTLEDCPLHVAMAPPGTPCVDFLGVAARGQGWLWRYRVTRFVDDPVRGGTFDVVSFHQVTTDLACVPRRELRTRVDTELVGAFPRMETHFSLPPSLASLEAGVERPAKTTEPATTAP